MDVAQLHAALARKRARRVNHRWRPGKIHLEPDQARKVLGERTRYEAEPSWQQGSAVLRVRLLPWVTPRTGFGQNDVSLEPCKPALQFGQRLFKYRIFGNPSSRCLLCLDFCESRLPVGE